MPGPDERQNDGGAGLRQSSRPLDLRLRQPWTIARGTSTFKTNVLVRLTEGDGEGEEAGLGEAAPNLRYGEDSRTVAAALGRLTPLLARGLKDWSGLLDRL